jgi:hypothetical protein
MMWSNPSPVPLPSLCVGLHAIREKTGPGVMAALEEAGAVQEDA